MKSALISALALFPTVAMAACPTAEDLTDGIRFDVVGGDWEVFKRLNSNAIEARYFFGAGSGVRNLLAQGLYLVEFADFEDNDILHSTRVTYSFPLSLGDMPVPQENGGWNTKAVAFSLEDGFYTETHVYTFGTERTKVFGACSYKMLPIEIRYPIDGEDTGDVDVIHWLPELGIGYLAASKGEDYHDTYDYISISSFK